MSAEQLLDRALALTALPPRRAHLDDYAYDPDDAAPVRACKLLAVKYARLGDDDSVLLALLHAQAHVGGYAEV